MTKYAIQSYPDAPDQYTRLELDDVAQTLAIQYSSGGQLRTVATARIGLLFLIRFRRIDLGTKQMAWGYVQYAPTRAPRVTPVPAEQKLILEYDDVAGHVQRDPRDSSVPPFVQDLPDMTVEPIDVTVTINAAVLQVNHGWINFDISHRYPAQVANSATAAWEQTIHFPYLDFSGQSLEGLIPPMQYAAVYTRTTRPDVVNTGSGVAMHVENERGHDTTAAWGNNVLLWTLRNSVHLSSRSYVRPEAYTLSLGDDYGFGGNRIVYRLRAFQMRGAAAGVPLDWYDVLDVYRRWLRTRFTDNQTSLFYNKLPSVVARPKNAPVDLMAPHTVIANYGLDGAVDTATPRLAGWLEMHPIRHGAPDTQEAKDNASFVTLVKRLQAKFPQPDAVKLEVQAWGIEKAGFYQFICGWKPLTNVLSGDDTKFRTAVNALAANHHTPLCVTTDPLNTIFNRGRYAGHIHWTGTDWSKIADPSQWTPFITRTFPAAVRNDTCAVTQTKISAKTFSRVWFVEPVPGIVQIPHSAHAVAFTRSQKVDEWGRRRADPPVIASGLYRASQKQICPTEEVAGIYLREWLRPWLIDQNVRIAEFMKHPREAYFCFDPDHQHVVAHAHNPFRQTAGYTNVIGRGSWYVRRMQCILFDTHEAGKKFDADGLCSFRLVNESLPNEALVAYFDEYYEHRKDEMFGHVYSHLMPEKQSPGRGGWGAHPGYREERKAPSSTLIRPAWMLDKARDSDPLPADLAASFRNWRQQCVEYFDAHFTVAEWGVAPRAYPVQKASDGPLVPWNPQHPLAPTNPRTYTYNRCVQQTFNLRANIFLTGEAAVRGVRIMVPSLWMETPFDYDAEALEHAVRAARLQMDNARFFRFGRLLGETTIVSVNGAALREVWAWGHGLNVVRTFADVAPLTAILAADDHELGTEWHSVPLYDFMSKPWDKYQYPGNITNSITTTRQIEHRVWQTADAKSALYAFANASNTDANVVFVYGRGLEGVTEATQWRATITTIAPLATAPLADVAWAGRRQKIVVPARSFVAVTVQK